MLFRIMLGNDSTRLRERRMWRGFGSYFWEKTRD